MAVPGLSEIFHSRTDTYTVESVLGKGAFGTVAKCWRRSDSKPVAMKMIKRDSLRIERTKAEISVLEELRVLNADKCSLVRYYQAFNDKSFTYLEFECLDKSLLDFMKGRYFQPLSLEVIRPIIKQMASALYHLKALGIVHGDLKPENVMLVDQRLHPYRVKIIDFSLAHKLSNANQGTCIQTLPYQAPEIMLALPYTTAVDVWSLGCITAFLYLGELLYPGRTPYEMLKYIVETQGRPPDKLLDRGSNTGLYFKKDFSSSKSSWRLKNIKEFYKDQTCHFKENRKRVLSSLNDFLHLRAIVTGSTADRQAYKDQFSDINSFVDMLKGTLQLDAAQRLTPRLVVQHQFISMAHFSMDSPSSYAMSSQKRMEVCRHSAREADWRSKKKICGASQPVKQNTSVHPDSGAAAKRDFPRPRPSTSPQLPWCSPSQKTDKHDGDTRGEVKVEQLRQQAEAKPSSRRSPAATCSAIDQGARLSSPLLEMDKAPEGTKTPQPFRKRKDELFQLWKRSADEWTSSSQSSSSSTNHHCALLTSALPGKMKVPEDFRLPEPDKKRLDLSLQPPTSSSQTKKTEDVDRHERKCVVAQSACHGSHVGASSTHRQGVRIASTLPISRLLKKWKEEQSQKTKRGLSPTKGETASHHNPQPPPRS